MSDSEGDISDELLELAGATEKKRKKRQAESKSGSKRRKADINVDDSDDNMPESEEEGNETNPYPLDGKFVNEADRNRLMQMSEIEREDILAQRQEEMQRIQDKRNLDQMLQAQSGRGDENVSKAAKRQHAVRGATKEKSRKLDELKAKRKAKDEKKRTRTNSPRQDPSSSPVDMEMSDDEEEDGQISKYEEQEEKDRRLYDKFDKSKSDDEPATLEDLEKCQLSRDMLARFSMAPWFEEAVKGGWVRFLIGMENGEGVYRICEVSNLGTEVVKPYKVNDQTVDQQLELKHGVSTKCFHMDKVSNSRFEQKEFDRLSRTFEHEKLKLPSKRQLEKKAAQIIKFMNQRLTESDISAIVARKKQLQSGQTVQQSPAALALERARLAQARTLAGRRQDWDEVAAIDLELEALNATAPVVPPRDVSRADILARVNERNRKANMEAVRRAEAQEVERKRRERRMLAAGGGTPRSGTPLDPSARLKTMPKLFSPRPDTPGTPSFQAGGITPRSLSPLPSATSSASPPKAASISTSFEASVIQSVEIDLGDF
ncbi:uncharacterized protein FIBRA_03911 [Fibroporia radiculosa]|uniref:Plus3 domain-containing protein n=1 Tax=Fibroporia radiculosa TaxID=599839 RepID=J4I9V9_9APHY|nr:uncharacterized protein FIBRA_03911 [Fibroporia radiculosa]CCM01841.1 predicted protein [Fibroporia radiculosa]